MAHLGERVSALVDGELNHTERERALAHLTFCADCRREVESMRALKTRLRSLETPAMPADLTMSLLRMAEPGGPLPPRERPFPSRTFGGVPIPGPHSIAPLDNRPRRDATGGGSGPGRGSRRRTTYVAVGVVSAAVALGTFFAASGVGQNNPAPPVELFQQQARTTPTNAPSTATP
ncbi:anti-sigma factor family protein [Nonomuraea fuscirosea]|jgi:anti-sigma factor RsiW|uniref:Putative zinc finger protein n=1 Tax=Nonomuraea fuscirosea TaxID=1291556 RepID=A0A2T0N1A7_9ACTN|nr:zf-HC2 domain-containing protein [Nonomuraea fuscirosea]PRX65551.1 putative zinc finger protein [Nonomuraea fuscirosea]WSA52992.1 zf-HC2 domain-containing protein [Nonomuraea fuscirosea]